MFEQVVFRCQFLSVLVKRRPGGPDSISDLGCLLLLDSLCQYLDLCYRRLPVSLGDMFGEVSPLGRSVCSRGKITLPCSNLATTCCQETGLAIDMARRPLSDRSDPVIVLLELGNHPAWTATKAGEIFSNASRRCRGDETEEHGGTKQPCSDHQQRLEIFGTPLRNFSWGEDV